MMILLLILIFGLTEFARAWWLKNQLNNAARVAVRVAIVTPGLTLVADDPGESCSWTTTCTTSSDNDVVKKACASITNQNLCGDGGANAARVKVEQVLPDVPPSGVTSGDTIKVTVNGVFLSLFPNLTFPDGTRLVNTRIPMSTTASMRYE